MPLLRNWRKKLVTKSDDKKVPALRFKGFTDDWEQRKLEKMVNFFSGLTYHPHDVRNNGCFVIRSSNIQNNQIVSADDVFVNRSIVNVPNVEQGDIIVVVRNGSRKLIGKHARVLSKMSNTVIGAFMTVLRSDDNSYINALLDSDQFQKEIYKNLGSTINQITTGEFKKMNFMVAKESENKKIGKFFKLVDNLISLQQRKLEQLTLLKKAMLQQILTTNDYPKIRFRGFTNVWDQRRLEKIAKITTGKLDANAMVKNGKYDFYTSGIKKFKINTAAFEGPAITIAGNGATVGYMHLADGKFNAYQRTYVLNQFTVNRLFLFYSVKKVLPRSIYQSARTGNIPYIVLNMITDLKINIPKEKEQKKIGELFTEIQAILINQKNRLRCIKDLKQYLLQNIFL